MIDIAAVTRMHQDTVERWHREDVDNPYEGVLGLACQQHAFNFLLWHQEDIARSPDVGDARIAEVKRAIDRYNQQRNDWIEKIDDWLTEQLAQRGIAPSSDLPMNTETPGSVVDRLSIIAIRIYHLDEQTQRSDASADHLDKVRHKLAVCRLQRDELAGALVQLLADIEAGRKRHRTYRQMKMYNDPTLNPYLYKSAQPK